MKDAEEQKVVTEKTELDNVLTDDQLDDVSGGGFGSIIKLSQLQSSTVDGDW